MEISVAQVVITMRDDTRFKFVMPTRSESLCLMTFMIDNLWYPNVNEHYYVYVFYQGNPGKIKKSGITKLCEELKFIKF